MTTRSTTSAHQPPPPFYGQHTTGTHRNALRGSEPSQTQAGAGAVTINVTLGRGLDAAALGTVNPQIIDAAHVHLVSLHVAPSHL